MLFSRQSCSTACVLLVRYVLFTAGQQGKQKPHVCTAPWMPCKPESLAGYVDHNRQRWLHACMPCVACWIQDLPITTHAQYVIQYALCLGIMAKLYHVGAARCKGGACVSCCTTGNVHIPRGSLSHWQCTGSAPAYVLKLMALGQPSLAVLS